jgi:hypothetical protein
MRRRLAIVGPSVLLGLIAATQMILASTTGLSPWKGGGFGMFASVDGAPFRRVRIYVYSAERSEEIALPASMEASAQRVAAWPHRRALEGLARAVVARERRHGRAIERVRVEVWRTDVSTTLDVYERLVRDLTFDACGHAPSPGGELPRRRLDGAAADTRHSPASATR